MSSCLVIMGVSGVGKTTIARLLAERLDLTFAEADDFHPPDNIAKMSDGVALTDADRQPWLEAIRDWIDAHAAAGNTSIVTCSALKHRYRQVLRQASARVRFVYLHGTPELLAARIGERGGHFMPPSLLKSQLDALEPLHDDEDGVTVDVSGTPAEVTAKVVSALQQPNP